jgi:hypothetical protein
MKTNKKTQIAPLSEEKIKQIKNGLRAKLKASKKEMMILLYGLKKGEYYPWDDENAVVKFMNHLLGDVPKNFWPTDESERIYIKDGNWQLKIFTCDEREQHADLSYAKDDHTAWVVRGRNGKFKNFDIGGS